MLPSSFLISKCFKGVVYYDDSRGQNESNFKPEADGNGRKRKVLSGFPIISHSFDSVADPLGSYLTITIQKLKHKFSCDFFSTVYILFSDILNT